MHSIRKIKELSTFVRHVEQSMQSISTVAATLAEVDKGLRVLLSAPGFLEREVGLPIEGDFTPRLLYRHPVLDFTVVASILPVQGQTGIHDHGDTWAVYGVYQGSVHMTRWARADDGSRPGLADLSREADFRMTDGDVAVFPPGAVHRIRNTSAETSVSLICYGRDFAKVWRNEYDPQTGTVKRVCWGPQPLLPRADAAAGPVLWPAQHAVYRPDRMGKSTLFETPNVIVGLNAFEPGQEHALHTHGDRDKLYCLLEGQGQLLLRDGAVEIEQGTLVPAPIGMPHGIRNTGLTRLLLLTVLAPGARS